MMPSIDPWLMSILEASLKGSLILAAALVATRMMRRASAETRHSVLAIGLSAFLLLPAATLLAPRWTLILPDIPLSIVGTDRPPVVAAQAPAAASKVEKPSAARAGSVSPSAGPRARPVVAAGTMVAPPASALAPRARRPIDWSRGVLLIWIAGTSLIVLRLVVGLARLWFLSRRSTLVTDGAWLHAAHTTARQLGLNHGVTLLRGEDAGAPMTWGVLRPVVWLPPAASAWPPELRAAVLSHELAHVKRRDAVTQWLANIAIAIHWFNPVVWAAARSLRVEREHACDDAVLALGARADEYAGQLLEMVRELGTMSGGPAPALAMARRSQLEGRLLAILDRATERGPVPSTRVLAVATFAFVFVAVLGGARVSRGATPPSDEAAYAQVTTALAQVEARAAVAQYAAVAARADEAIITEGDAWNRIRAHIVGAGRVEHPADGFTYMGNQKPRVIDLEPARAAVAALPSRMSLRGVSAPVPMGVATPRGWRPNPAILDGSRRADSVWLAIVERQSARPDSALLLEIIAATEGISSSEQRVSVLERIARMPSLDSSVVTALARTSIKVSSTAMRVKLLRTIIQQQPHARGASRAAVLAAINTISSASEQGSLLELFLGPGELDPLALVDGLRAAGKMPGSTAKTNVLVAAAKAHRIDGAAREAYLRSAGTIETSSDRVRALTALLADPGDSRR